MLGRCITTELEICILISNCCSDHRGADIEGTAIVAPPCTPRLLLTKVVKPSAPQAEATAREFKGPVSFSSPSFFYFPLFGKTDIIDSIIKKQLHILGKLERHCRERHRLRKEQRRP
jgi:hypothetical protein